MGMPGIVERDERAIVVENASYRWAYLVQAFGLLLIVAWRSFERHESSWDLLALVILGGAVATIYQAAHHVLGRRWALLTFATMALAAAVAAIAVFAGRR
jgi:hypothetical protein